MYEMHTLYAGARVSAHAERQAQLDPGVTILLASPRFSPLASSWQALANPLSPVESSRHHWNGSTFLP